jgi:hypothetical protein
MEITTTSKFGPTSGPKEKYFSRFEKYFNSLTDDQLQEIVSESADRIRFFAPEDDLTREFQIRVKNFFAEFRSSNTSFQRGDYLEFSNVLMVSIQ